MSDRRFDVFLSHNGKDKPAVLAIARALVDGFAERITSLALGLDGACVVAGGEITRWDIGERSWQQRVCDEPADVAAA